MDTQKQPLSAARCPEPDATRRDKIRVGLRVDVVLKKDQPTGALTTGTVAKILTNSKNHPRGIKVMLKDGRVGRVQKIHAETSGGTRQNSCRTSLLDF